jgi:hypothetical protein
MRKSTEMIFFAALAFDHWSPNLSILNSLLASIFPLFKTFEGRHTASQKLARFLSVSGF